MLTACVGAWSGVRSAASIEPGGSGPVAPNGRDPRLQRRRHAGEVEQPSGRPPGVSRTNSSVRIEARPRLVQAPELHEYRPAHEVHGRTRTGRQVVAQRGVDRPRLRPRDFRTR